MGKPSPPPVWSSIDKPTGKGINSAWQMWFSMLYAFLTDGQVGDNNETSIQAPLTGFNIVVPAGITVLVLNPSGTLSSGTVITPVSPRDGQNLQVCSTQTITSLIFSPSTGQTIKNTPLAISAGSGFEYFYDQSSTTWFRLR